MVIVVTFFLLFMATFITFTVSLISFIVVKIKNKRVPGIYSKIIVDKWKISLIISSSLFGTMLALFIGIFMLLYLAIAHM